MRGAWGVGLLLAGSLNAQSIPPLPDSSGWGVHVLAIERAPDSAIWVGTYGHGIFVLRKGAGRWEQIRSSGDTAAHAISWDFVHAFGFGPRGQIWSGTVGNGCGLEIGWYLEHGDEIELEVEKIGVLRNKVERQDV